MCGADIKKGLRKQFMVAWCISSVSQCPLNISALELHSRETLPPRLCGRGCTAHVSLCALITQLAKLTDCLTGRLAGGMTISPALLYRYFSLFAAYLHS